MLIGAIANPGRLEYLGCMSSAPVSAEALCHA